MTLSISGTGATVIPGAATQPSKAVGVVKSQQNTNTQTNINNADAQALTIAVSDTEGGATNAAGMSASASGLSHALGPYGTSVATADAVNAAAGNVLGNLTLAGSQAPGASAIAVTGGNSVQTNAGGVTLTTAVPPTKFIVTDTINNSNHIVQGTAYTGPAGVSSQYVVQSDSPALSATNLNITALAPSVFIHTGSGVDAINVAGVGGRNILDGGTNSNFLVGGAAGSGADTFFVDARDAASDIWNTVTNFHAGDAVTLFGITPTNKAIAWADGQGTTGATGLTLHATQAGAPQASFTLAGYTTADLGGRLGVTYGTEPDGTPYLYVVGLK